MWLHTISAPVELLTRPNDAMQLMLNLPLSSRFVGSLTALPPHCGLPRVR